MSFARIATLKISDQNYDLTFFRYGFWRETDKKGRPSTGINGGTIVLTMESTRSTELLERFLNTDPGYPANHPPRAISGSIEVCDPEDGMVIRKLVFEEAFLVQSGEQMHTDSPLPMMATITISPLRLDIDRTIRLDRRWPQTSGGWKEYVQEEPIAVMTKESEPSFTIIDVYWINKNGDEIRDLYTEIEVTLYVKIKENEAIGQTIPLTFEHESKDGVKTFEGFGKVDSDHIITIENFKLELIKQEER